MKKKMDSLSVSSSPVITVQLYIFHHCMCFLFHSITFLYNVLYDPIIVKVGNLASKKEQLTGKKIGISLKMKVILRKSVLVLG